MIASCPIRPQAMTSGMTRMSAAMKACPARGVAVDYQGQAVKSLCNKGQEQCRGSTLATVGEFYNHGESSQ